MCQKSTYQAELDKGHTHWDYSVKIEAELAEDNMTCSTVFSFFSILTEM